MNTIVSQVAYFLKQYPPFNNLTIEELSIVAMSIKVINLEKIKIYFKLMILYTIAFIWLILEL